MKSRKRYGIRPLGWVKEGRSWGAHTVFAAYKIEPLKLRRVLLTAMASTGYSEWIETGRADTVGELMRVAQAHHNEALIAECLDV